MFGKLRKMAKYKAKYKLIILMAITVLELSFLDFKSNTRSLHSFLYENLE
jgi:hypothetical protein